ncbi:MAG: Jag N-terminal domain-containing protein [Endomicrobiia bacterium]|nr:Jag N-terminal domain-containing protein [Endomicrobiia bacterium]
MKYEFRGRTVRDAIAKGLKKLSLVEEDVDITILDEGLRGLFSIEGKQQARVMIEPKSRAERADDRGEPPDYARAQRLLKEYALEILAGMNIIPDTINTSILTGRIYANIICCDPEIAPGEETIHALETILFELLNKTRARGVAGAAVKIHLDCNFVIRQKEDALREEAIGIARLVAADGKPRQWPGGHLVFNYRKVIHDAVREVGGVSSRSNGRGDEKVVEIFRHGAEKNK